MQAFGAPPESAAAARQQLLSALALPSLDLPSDTESDVEVQSLRQAHIGDSNPSAPRAGWVSDGASNSAVKPGGRKIRAPDKRKRKRSAIRKHATGESASDSQAGGGARTASRGRGRTSTRRPAGDGPLGDGAARPRPFKGVYVRDGWKWRSMITFRGVNFHVGNYKTAVDAAKAHDRVMVALYGPEARTNFPVEGYRRERFYAEMHTEENATLGFRNTALNASAAGGDLDVELLREHVKHVVSFVRRVEEEEGVGEVSREDRPEPGGSAAAEAKVKVEGGVAAGGGEDAEAAGGARAGGRHGRQLSASGFASMHASMAAHSGGGHEAPARRHSHGHAATAGPARSAAAAAMLPRSHSAAEPSLSLCVPAPAPPAPEPIAIEREAESPVPEPRPRTGRSAAARAHPPRSSSAGPHQPARRRGRPKGTTKAALAARRAAEAAAAAAAAAAGPHLTASAVTRRRAKWARWASGGSDAEANSGDDRSSLSSVPSSASAPAHALFWQQQQLLQAYGLPRARPRRRAAAAARRASAAMLAATPTRIESGGESEDLLQSDGEVEMANAGAGESPAPGPSSSSPALRPSSSASSLLSLVPPAGPVPPAPPRPHSAPLSRLLPPGPVSVTADLRILTAAPATVPAVPAPAPAHPPPARSAALGAGPAPPPGLSAIGPPSFALPSYTAPSAFGAPGVLAPRRPSPVRAEPEPPRGRDGVALATARLKLARVPSGAADVEPEGPCMAQCPESPVGPTRVPPCHPLFLAPEAPPPPPQLDDSLFRWDDSIDSSFGDPSNAEGYSSDRGGVDMMPEYPMQRRLSLPEIATGPSSWPAFDWSQLSSTASSSGNLGRS